MESASGASCAAMRIVRAGAWKYDGTVDQPVDIVSFESDWWFELAAADDSLDVDEQPQPMGPDGVLYYVRFRKAGSPDVPTWVGSIGHADIAEAMLTAEANAPSPIRWAHA